MQPAKAFTISAHGAEMPVIGYGTMLFPEPEKAAGLVSAAIECGYRHIDTARKYGSEQWVGEGIRATGIDRGELFVTTKVTEENAREADFARSVDTSLKTLGLDYVDLLLIHWPQPSVPLAETLGALAKAKRQGLARHIGVSNFTLALLDEAVHLCPEPLVTNQIEYHAYLRQDKLLAACRRHGLLVTCHAPIARGELLKDPLISEIAAARGKSTAQVALRWLIQQPGVAAVPRALEVSEIEENIDLFDFELSDEEMERIGTLRDKNVRIVDPEVRRPVWDAP
ncbi:MAG: aldo/keto reductase [Rhizobiales bacterium]|nr:aldo/keto reductase [Hyphomicrobiales bacterium]